MIPILGNGRRHAVPGQIPGEILTVEAAQAELADKAQARYGLLEEFGKRLAQVIGVRDGKFSPNELMLVQALAGFVLGEIRAKYLMGFIV